VVIGSDFDDTLGSSTSGHVLQGGAGNDIYVVGISGVDVVEAAGGGLDSADHRGGTEHGQLRQR
jgi:hypothetical protein